MKLKDPQIKIVTVHASSALRQLINTELRAKGYQDIIAAPDLQTVVDILETDVIDWLITPLITDEQLNVFQILKLVTEQASLMDMKVSFLVDAQTPAHFLTKAFDLGLLSFHRNMQTKTDIEREFADLFARYEACEESPSLLAASYLRQILLEEKRAPELLRFEKALFHLNSGHFRLFLALAEAHLLNEQSAEANQLAQRALLVAPELKEPFERLFMQYRTPFEEGVMSLPSGEKQDILGIRSCLLVEPHAATRAAVEKLLLQLGIAEVVPFAEADAALQWLKEKNKPELVIFEWRLGSLPGPIFVQRLRELIGLGKPVTVMNKDLSERDMPILREMGVTDRIKKPIETHKFLQDVIWIIHQDRAPSEPFILLQKIRQAMLDQNYEQLANYTKRYMDSPKASPSDKLLLQAELAYFRGQYAHAKSLAIETLKSGPARVEILNLLGKTLMRLRDFESALTCLENAEIMSPKNVQRICDIAEAHLEMGQDQFFVEKEAEAAALSPESAAVAELSTKSALVKGDSSKAKALMQSLPSLINIISFTNNRAISLTRCERFDEGTSLYDEAIQALPDEKLELKAVLFYNLGLAQARSNRLVEAQGSLDQAAELSGDKVQPKVLSLRKRLDRALKSKEPLELFSPQTPVQLGESTAQSDPQKDYDELMMALKIGPGDIACHKIYYEQPMDARLKGWIDRPLRFRRRSTLKKASDKAS